MHILGEFIQELKRKEFIILSILIILISTFVKVLISNFNYFYIHKKILHFGKIKKKINPKEINICYLVFF